MSSADVHVVILAAGQGTRMKSALPKVLHSLAGKPLVERVLASAAAVSPATLVLVVGHGGDAVKERLRHTPHLRFVTQQPQLGTAHALRQTEPVLAGKSGTVVLLSGDVPLLTGRTLQGLVEAHRAANAAATVVTATIDRPYGYGRILRSDGAISRIVEERDAGPAERAIREINSGIYAFDLPPLFDALSTIATGNAQGEYYLTDLVSIYRARGLQVATHLVEDAREVLGINSRSELAEMGRIVRQKVNEALMAAGVTLIDPASTYIEPQVEVGADTVIHPGVTLEGQTRVGSACEIRSHVRIRDSVIGDRATINDCCVLTGATVGPGSSVGPFAHLRPDSVMGEGSKVGNFVELKKTTLGPGSKANHLTYLGDATIGEHVNVGAGTITCNYDGVQKHPTVIEDGAFIGSDTQLIAPVRIGRGAYVGAGSSITEDVPPGALGIGRGRQANVEGWAERQKKAPSKG
jgi:bifunctional UDP-N-acetylglucosamine pyrophosphorylase/glucosamine-1-phosphate N-acetyltransferase